MTLYLNQLIPERNSKDIETAQSDLGLGAEICHKTLILDKSVNLLKPRSLCNTSERKHPPGKALQYPLTMELVLSVEVIKGPGRISF